MPRFGPDNFRSVLSHGKIGQKRALLLISPYVDFQKEAALLMVYDKKAKKTGGVRVPIFYKSGNHKEIYYAIQADCPEGKRILENYPHSTPSQKKDLAKLYWQTQSTTKQLSKPAATWTDVVLSDLSERLKEGRVNGAFQRGIITEELKDKAIESLFKNSKNLSVYYFFNLFQNTDIIETPEGERFIYNVWLRPKLDGFGMAMMLWGIAMRWPGSFGSWIGEMNAWLTAFISTAPLASKKLVDHMVYTNMIERTLSTLLVDLPLARKPFDEMNTKQIKEKVKFFQTFLNFLISAT